MVEKQKENAGIIFILLHKNSIRYHITLELIVFWKFLCLQIFFTDEKAFYRRNQFIQHKHIPALIGDTFYNSPPRSGRG